MIGSILIKVAFIGVVLSALGYFISLKRKDEAWVARARYSFHLGVLGTILSAALLIYLILNHQFQYTYVWNYSSTDLPTPLLVSTFYAGQEGSFMLWALFTAIVGLILMQYSAKRGYEREIMSVYALIQVFLLLMLIIKSPFEYVWETFPKDVEKGFVPPNGRGLNPLLQNYWMVIHPPILFIGFTSMSVPFAHAVAALIRRDYHDWIRAATPWTVFGVAALGTGITLGGFWAYETLGWGGYWGWDPVENSSLIPWLICLASVHTMLSQRRSRTHVRTNFVLSILAFLLVLYSTFLTRSGVLADTSVHSFVEPGMWAYIVLLGVIFLFTVIGFGLFFRRIKEMPRVKVEHSIYSREFALFLGASALVVCGVFVIAGTSSPIITGFFQGKPSAVDTSFYEKTSLPIGIIVALLSGVGQLVWWKHSKKSSIQKNLLFPFVGAVIVTLALIFMGMRQLPVGMLTFATAFTLFANLSVAYVIFRGNPILGGGSVAHIGMALFFFGIIGSSFYSEKETIALERGKPVSSLGWTLNFTGYHPVDKERYGFHVEVEKEGRRYLLTPVMYYSEYSKGIIRNPDIANFWTNDLYLSPVSLDSPEDAGVEKVTLRRGKAELVGAYTLTFTGFDFGEEERLKMLEGGAFTLGVKITAEKGRERVTLIPKMRNTGGSITYEPATLGETKLTISRIQPDGENPDNSFVELAVESGTSKPQNLSDSETLVIEASIKPFINVVWMGSFTILVGFIMTIIRRLREVRTSPL